MCEWTFVFPTLVFLHRMHLGCPILRTCVREYHPGVWSTHPTTYFQTHTFLHITTQFGRDRYKQPFVNMPSHTFLGNVGMWYTLPFAPATNRLACLLRTYGLRYHCGGGSKCFFTYIVSAAIYERPFVYITATNICVWGGVHTQPVIYPILYSFFIVTVIDIHIV